MTCPRETVGAYLKATGPDDAARANHRRGHALARVRGRTLLGVRFRRQHAIGRYIVDFYCREARLVAELDGSSHRGRVDLDAQRDQFLLDHGERVLRLENEQVLLDIDSALARIAATLPTG